ncbi:NIPSNAP family protein [Oricola indica]|uniref:NIPSNAP family protein n=1 Tax=Oricola indica TaxID=2872591 RepID=UPI001CC0A875|nr:NIPSNAP family protein [Oricola indica]
MIIEKRTYTFHPGKVQEFLELYEREGLPLHTKYLPLAGYFVSDIGTLNQVITMWRYESMADREEKRAALYADPEWTAFAPKTTHMIQKMETTILRPTPWSPLN